MGADPSLCPAGAGLTLLVTCSCHQNNGTEFVEYSVTCAGRFQHLGCMNLLLISICPQRKQSVTPTLRVN